jgi:adenine-specific DNA-methyltransferase
MQDSEKPKLDSIPADTLAKTGQNFDKLKAKLRELFELDKADLDFGIYRVLRQRHGEIAEFLDKHLEKTARTALTTFANVQTVQLKHELEKAEAAAAGAGIAPQQSPRVMELRDKIIAGADLESTADEVYSHLLTFFSRYYQGGDFLGLHRSTVHGREKYMIPYNGEEVKLVWANMDQYYIKSSELLRDYSFRIRKAELAAGELNLNDLPDESTIRFKLVEGDTEKDNRKPDGRTTRVFTLDEAKPFEEYGDTLHVNFRYREHTSERNLQEKLNVNTEKTLAESLQTRWKRLLFAADPTHQPKDKRDTRTLLEKHLHSYTAKYLFDYFIHKDLGGFLRRELDFYIKNEVMRLDDIENTTAPKAEEYLSKICAIRRCALPVIQMLAQLEEFQKKLWLKKKFVVETRYCLTLDRVPETLYPEICTNESQWREWEELYAISAIEHDLLTPDSAFRTPRWLKANPYLMLDTRHFTRDFTFKLLAYIENLDASLHGVCFHSENFQALQLMQERYREDLRTLAFDPPYNTGRGDFTYKDSYQRSSWSSMICDRLASARNLLCDSGALFVTIDDREHSTLRFHLNTLFGESNLDSNCIWQKKYSPQNDAKTLSSIHDHILVFAKNASKWRPNLLTRTDEAKARYKNPDQDPRGVWKSGDLTSKTKAEGHSYPITSPTTRKVFLPTSGRQWAPSYETFTKLLADNRIWFGPDGNNVPSLKQFLSEVQDGTVGMTIWWREDVGDNQEAARVIADLGFSFESPKPPRLFRRILDLSTRPDRNDSILDFFAGSGTTGHAVIDANREDNGNRKYLLVEMGEYFDTVLVPRLKKVVYSSDWKEGKPQSPNKGLSHAFKVIRLEAYEDTLNNLRLRRTRGQEAALADGSEANRDQYLLSYFLEVESAGSSSLLNLDEFRDPFAYKLAIATSSAGETKETTVDLVETFNWLLGLKVKHIDTAKGFLTVTGEKRAGGRCFIIWRTLTTDPKADNEALEKFLSKLAVNPADTEFDFIYVNGAHTLNDPHNKVHLIQEVFQRLMFDTTNFESLS